MSFRQRNKEPERLWVKERRQELLAAGIPALVLDNEKWWSYLLLHGDDRYQSGWTVEWISHEQAKDLLSLLRSQPFWTGISYDIFRELEKRIKG